MHPPSCPSPEPGTEIPEDTGARRHLKACPPEALQPRGVEVRTKLKSRTSPREAARRKIRSSPVYAGHTIKPLINLRFSRAPAVSDRIEARRMTERPCPHSTGTKVPLPFERPCGRPEGIVSYGLGCTEYEHRRASDSQHVRRRLFIRSRPACQEQKSGRCEPDARAEIGVNPEIPAQTGRSFDGNAPTGLLDFARLPMLSEDRPTVQFEGRDEFVLENREQLRKWRRRQRRLQQGVRSIEREALPAGPVEGVPKCPQFDREEPVRSARPGETTSLQRSPICRTTSSPRPAVTSSDSSPNALKNCNPAPMAR